MRAVSKASLVASTLVALALVGGGIAFAGSWFATSPTLTVKKLTTVAMPDFDSRPAVDLRNGTVTIQWIAQKLVKGVNVQRYIVRRYNAATGATTKICGDVTVSRCRDTDVPPGTWDYTVRTAQYLWTGPESRHSDPITVPATVAVQKAAASTPAPAPTQTTEAPQPDVSPSASSVPTPTATATPTTTAPSPETSTDPVSPPSAGEPT